MPVLHSIFIKYIQVIWWETESFLTEIRNKKMMSPVITLFQHHTESPKYYNKKKKGKEDMQNDKKKKRNKTLFTFDKIFYVENVK